MRELRRVSSGVVIVTVVAVVLLGARPIRVETILAGYGIALAAIVLTALTNAMGAAQRREPSPFRAELTRQRVPPSRPPELVRVERELTLASASAGHAHNRLRPLLWEIARARGVALEAETAALLSPDRPPPPDLAGPGLPLRRIRQIVDELERTGWS